MGFRLAGWRQPCAAPASGARLGLRNKNEWWDYARRSAHALAAGELPTAIRVFGPVLGPGEAALLEAHATYSRLYGGSGQFVPASLFAVGRPAVIVGAAALQAVVNHRRKKAAEHAAAARWRDDQEVSVIATTERLLCNTEQGLVSVYYNCVTEFYPDLENWSLTVGFGVGYAPLRLQGPATVGLNLWTAYGIFGRDWIADRRLEALLCTAA